MLVPQLVEQEFHGLRRQVGGAQLAQEQLVGQGAQTRRQETALHGVPAPMVKEVLVQPVRLDGGVRTGAWTGVRSGRGGAMENPRVPGSRRCPDTGPSTHPGAGPRTHPARVEVRVGVRVRLREPLRGRRLGPFPVLASLVPLPDRARFRGTGRGCGRVGARAGPAVGAEDRAQQDAPPRPLQPRAACELVDQLGHPGGGVGMRAEAVEKVVHQSGGRLVLEPWGDPTARDPGQLTGPARVRLPVRDARQTQLMGVHRVVGGERPLLPQPAPEEQEQPQIRHRHAVLAG